MWRQGAKQKFFILPAWFKSGECRGAVLQLCCCRSSTHAFCLRLFAVGGWRVRRWNGDWVSAHSIVSSCAWARGTSSIEHLPQDTSVRAAPSVLAGQCYVSDSWEERQILAKCKSSTRVLEAELTVASYFKQTLHSGPTMEEVFFSVRAETIHDVGFWVISCRVRSSVLVVHQQNNKEQTLLLFIWRLDVTNRWINLAWSERRLCVSLNTDLCCVCSVFLYFLKNSSLMKGACVCRLIVLCAPELNWKEFHIHASSFQITAKSRAVSEALKILKTIVIPSS